MEQNMTQINGGITINVNMGVKNIMYVKNIMFGILLHVIMKMENMDDSAITCDEVIESNDEETKTIPINFNEKNITCKAQNFYVSLAFFLITIAILIAVSIYCCLI